MSLDERVEYVGIKRQGQKPVRYPADRVTVNRHASWVGVVIQREGK